VNTRALTTPLRDVSVQRVDPARVDLAQLYRQLLSKSWLIILFVVLSLLGAAFYLTQATKIYASRAAIQIDQEPQKVVNLPDHDTEDFKSQEVLNTIVGTLASDTLVLRVIKANGLDKDPAFAPPKKDGSAYLDSELIGRFKKNLTVSLRRGTRLIDIAVEDTDPKRAQKLTQSMVTEFVDQTFDQKFSVSKAASAFLTHEADRLREKLHNSDQALQQYREEHHAVSLEEKQNIVVEKLKELNQKVTEARSERLKFEADVATIEHVKKKNPEDLLLLSSVASLPVVADLRRQISDREAAFAQIKERYGELHPKYIEAQAQIKDLKQTLNRTLLNSGDLVMKSYEAAKATEDKLVAALKDQEDAALELNRIAIPYNVLVREVEADRALYDSVLAGMKETTINQSLGQRYNIRVIESPLVSSWPVKPRKLMTLALALLGGFVVGSTVVAGIAMADSSIRSVNQVEEILGLPVLTVVPRSKRRYLDKEPALTADPASHEAEAFRSLRTALSFLGHEKDFKTVLFTSANPGEGKTYCSFNCATALAQQGLRTLLIDADLRRPNLSKALLADAKAPGLTACLSGHATLMDCCKLTEIDHLFILGAGDRASKPAELLAAGDFAGLMKEAMVHFDRVVLDSAPINAVSDTQLIAQEIESVCLVIRAGKTPRRAIVRACSMLARATHSPDAVVLNRVVRRSSEDYYFGRYSKMYTTAAAYRLEDTAKRSESTVDQY
jgi:polysaccharide biosynthesis transport protein